MSNIAPRVVTEYRPVALSPDEDAMLIRREHYAMTGTVSFLDPRKVMARPDIAGRLLAMLAEAGDRVVMVRLPG